MNVFAITIKGHRGVPGLFQGNAEDVVAHLKSLPDTSDYEIYVLSLRNYISVEDFLRNYISRQWTKGLVPKIYTMDPKTEDMLSNGMRLRTGMKVLLAPSNLRERPEEAETLKDWQLERLQTNNRWCTVVEPPTFNNRNNTISFVGLYEDGTKHKRTYVADYAWLVKKDSLPDPVAEEEKEAQRYNKVYEIVKGAFDDHTNDPCPSCNGQTGIPDVSELEATTRKILGIL